MQAHNSPVPLMKIIDMTRAIIIDDIENARISLKADLLDYCPDVEVVGEAEGVVSGVKAIKELNPDVVFLDIQMNDGTGFDLLEILPEVNFKLIFTTASNEFAIKAFKFSAVDYLMKPIDPIELREAVSKASFDFNFGVETLKHNLNNGIERIALNSQDKIIVIKVLDIVRLESSGSYTLFYTKQGEQILVTKTLKEYDALLSDQGFIRVHQSHLINLDAVKEFVKNDGGYIKMLDGSDIPVSSRKKSLVLKTLTGIT